MGGVFVSTFYKKFLLKNYLLQKVLFPKITKHEFYVVQFAKKKKISL